MEVIEVNLTVKLLLTTLFYTSLYSYEYDMPTLCQKFNLIPGAKATIQWNRVFNSQRHLKRYKLDSLPQKQRKDLQRYLINHSADSQQPIVPGL